MDEMGSFCTSTPSFVDPVPATNLNVVDHTRVDVDRVAASPPDLFSLPSELLSDVTNYLNRQQDIFALGLTCRAFRTRLLLDPEIGSYCCQFVEFRVVSTRVVQPFFECDALPYVHRATAFLLPLRCYWEWISRTMPNLTCLALESPTFDDDEYGQCTFWPMGERLSIPQHLALVSEILDISKIQELDIAFLPASSVTEFLELGVDSDSAILWKEILSGLFPNLKNLHTMNGEYEVPKYVVGGDGESSSGPATLWETEKLDLFRTSLACAESQDFRNTVFPSLTSIDLYLAEVSAAGDCPLRMVFRRYRPLESVYLGVESFSGMTSGGIDSYGGPHLSLRALTLNFASMSAAGVEPVRFLLRLCPNLETLRLSNSSFSFGCLDKGDVALLDKSERLRYLELEILAGLEEREDFFEVGDMFVSLLGKFPRLVSLKLIVKGFVAEEEQDSRSRSPKLTEMVASKETFSSLRRFALEIEEDYGEMDDFECGPPTQMCPLGYEDLQRILLLCPSLDDLTVPLFDCAFSGVSDERFFEHATLECLDLYGYGMVLKWTDFVRVVKHFPCLNSLTLNSTLFEIDGSTPSSVNLEVLKSLRLMSSKLNEEKVREIIQRSPDFERLDYSAQSLCSFCVEEGNSFVMGERFPTKSLYLHANSTCSFPLIATLLANPFLESLYLSACVFSSQRLLDSISSLQSIPLRIVNLKLPSPSWETLIPSWETLIAFVTVFGGSLEEFKMDISLLIDEDEEEEEEEEWEEEEEGEEEEEAKEGCNETEVKNMTLAPNSIPICESLVRIELRLRFFGGSSTTCDIRGTLLELLRAFPRAVQVFLFSNLSSSGVSDLVIAKALREFLAANGRQDQVFVQWKSES